MQYNVSTLVDRNRATTIRMSDEEVAMLQALAEESGLSVSDYVRQYVRKAHAERLGSRVTKKAPNRAKRGM